MLQRKRSAVEGNVKESVMDIGATTVFENVLFIP